MCSSIQHLVALTGKCAIYKCSNIGGCSLHSDYGCFDGAHGRNMIEVSQ